LRNNPAEFAALRIGGAALVIVGGAFAFAQRQFGRLMGYAVMVDLGAALLAVGLGTADGLRAAMAIVALRTIGLAVWGLGLGWLKGRGGADFDDLAGKAWQMPFATAAVVIGGLSLAGFPLTAGFAGRWALYRQLAADNIGLAFVLLLASGSVVLAYARGIAALVRPAVRRAEADYEWPQEDQVAIAYLALGVLLIVALGLFPQLLLPSVTKAVEAFGALVR
jgi:formate hydrogenlyase subunit 3/multisubunit Na+/H+ antiporter MnhD subunit